MTSDDTFDLAAKAGISELMWWDHGDVLERFAALVAAAEREACAAAVHNALLEMGQPYGVCKVAVDSIKERNNQ